MKVQVALKYCMEFNNDRPLVLVNDADNFKYVFAWHHREADPADERARDLVFKDIRIRISEMLSLAGTRLHLGIYGSTPEWRNTVYRYKPYKGNRPPKADFVVKWGDIIEQYCINELGFVKMPKWETDDLIGWISRNSSPEYQNYKFMIASPDKDLQQLPGLHFAWKDKDNAFTSHITEVSEFQAAYNFWTQMLTGDTTDNVAGIPGLGPKKVQEIFKDLDNALDLELAVAEQYRKAFGEFYGPMIMRETHCALYAGPEEMNVTIGLDMSRDPLTYIQDFSLKLTDQNMDQIFDELMDEQYGFEV